MTAAQITPPAPRTDAVVGHAYVLPVVRELPSPAADPVGERAWSASPATDAYHASVDAEKVGLALTAIVFVTMRQEDRDTVVDFEDRVADVPEIVTAQRLFGDPDYLLRNS